MNTNNFLTDRPCVRPRQPPGGRSQLGFLFGEDTPAQPGN